MAYRLHLVEPRAGGGPLPIDLLRRAIDQLRAWRVVLPVHSTIERLSFRLRLVPNRTVAVPRVVRLEAKVC